MKILLIDDEEKIIELLSESLAHDGHELEGFTDPVLALESFFASPHQFDVVVTDHLMPAMLGTDIIQRIKSSYPDFPIVLATGNYTNDLDFGLQGGRYSQFVILQKPYRKEALVKTINSLVQSVPREQA